MKKMKLPRIIGEFTLRDITKIFTYNGKRMFSAHYTLPGKNIELIIRTIIRDQEREFEIALMGIKILGIKTIEEAVAEANKIAEENENFMNDNNITL